MMEKIPKANLSRLLRHIMLLSWISLSVASFAQPLDLNLEPIAPVVPPPPAFEPLNPDTKQVAIYQTTRQTEQRDYNYHHLYAIVGVNRKSVIRKIDRFANISLQKPEPARHYYKRQSEVNIAFGGRLAKSPVFPIMLEFGFAFQQFDLTPAGVNLMNQAVPDTDNLLMSHTTINIFPGVYTDPFGSRHITASFFTGPELRIMALQIAQRQAQAKQPPPFEEAGAGLYLRAGLDIFFSSGIMIRAEMRRLAATADIPVPQYNSWGISVGYIFLFNNKRIPRLEIE